MKTFLITGKPSRGTKEDFRIFRVKNNVPTPVGGFTINHISTRGALAEALGCLVEEKIVPKRALKLSVESWRGTGYYCEKVETEMKIRIIEL